MMCGLVQRDRVGIVTRYLMAVDPDAVVEFAGSVVRRRDRLAPLGVVARGASDSRVNRVSELTSRPGARVQGRAGSVLIRKTRVTHHIPGECLRVPARIALGLALQQLHNLTAGRS